MPTEGIAEGLVQEVLYSQDPARIYGTVNELLYSYEPAQVDNAVGEVLYAFEPPNLHNVLMEVLTSSAVFAVGGADQVVAPSTQVTLNASGSAGASSYVWALTVVPAGSGLSTGTIGSSASVNFTPDVVGTYTAKLSATGGGVTDFDYVDVVAAVVAVANAGVDKSTQPAVQVTLDGSGSTGTITTYAWALTAVPGASSFSVSASLGTAASVNFTPDVVGTYTARLTVDGPHGESVDTADVVVIGTSGPENIDSIFGISKDNIGSIMGITYGDIDKINDID